MARYFMRLQFLGASYHGWQIQPSGISVQEVIEKALSTLLRRPTKVTGAGRTDAGVNARLMVAHFDADTIDVCDTTRRLNAIVGRDIAIESITRVHDTAHARFDATSRTYHYYVNHRKSPFFNHLSWHCPNPLDYAAMNRAAALLTGIDDFTSFAKLHSDARTNICHVTKAVWHELMPGYHCFEITADRFLRNMVRAVVGTLVEVGRGKMSIDRFKEVIDSKNRCAAGTSMPGHALYLWDVTYPYPISEAPQLAR